MITDMLWALLAAQVFMGAFDTVYHHELTQRLAWRPSQAHELQLHGVRNLFYGALFLGVGWLAFHGLAAWAVAALLLVELGITLKDFVEEDMTRKLPASERVTHTLLALNYGAILALLAPVLMAWADEPSGIALVNYGWWSALASLAAVGVSIFGVRDLLASKRLMAMAALRQAKLLPASDKALSLLITGGTGFIGSRLVSALIEQNHRVTVLTRKMDSAAHLPTPIQIVTSLDQIASEQVFDAVINLAGEPIAGWMWTPRHKQRIVASRIETTQALLTLMARLKTKPSCLISGSAIGVYGVETGQGIDETARIEKDGSFAQQLCLDWETEAQKAEALGIRTVLLRTGIVLDTAGGSLSQMLFPFEFGLGGPFGSGKQMMSWITRDDLVRLIVHALTRDDIRGPLNGTAPQPVTNIAYTKALAKALHRPAVIAIPKVLLEILLGDLAREIFLAGQSVISTKAAETGFTFQARDIETAFNALLKPADLSKSASACPPEKLPPLGNHSQGHVKEKTA